MSPVRRRAVLAVAALILTACATPEGEQARRAEEPVALGHVHGLGVDPADGTLYAATHFGVYELAEDGSAERVADRWQDTMAFTVIGPGHFLASGHPDLREGLPAHLGLIESTDAARTWTALSLQGEADFHALEPAGDLLYGYDSVTRRLLVTRDRQRWRRIANVDVGDLAANPAAPDRVLATTAEGVTELRSDGGGQRLVDGAPPLVLLDWPTADELIGVTADGDVHASNDAGASWQPAGTTPGEPQAIEITEDAWYVATTGGIYRTTGDGRRWVPLWSSGAHRTSG